jgi:hypothetical protein
MSRKVWMSVLLVVLLALFASTVYAQDGPPRPTPTNVAPGDNPPGENPPGEDPPGMLQSSDPRGSIRGTVYEDLNADGRCVGTGEPALAGVTIQFVSNDGNATVYLYSGDNGTYGLVAAGLGTWTVTAQPPAGHVVTSKNPLQVFLGPEEDQQLVLGVDFCVYKGTTIVVPPIFIPPGVVAPPVFLPESGARVAPAVGGIMLLGAGLFVFGLALERRRRSTSDEEPTS